MRDVRRRTYKKESKNETILRSLMEANIPAIEPDVPLDTLSEQVEKARAALEAWFQGNDPTKWRTVRELRHEVRNGWLPAALMIAINRLIAEGRFETDGSLRVRPVT